MAADEVGDEGWKAGGGSFGYDGQGVGDGDGGGAGVDEPDGAGGWKLVDEAGGGVDGEGGADHEEQVGVADFAQGAFVFGDGFAEEDDVGAQLCAVGGEVAEAGGAGGGKDQVGVAFAAGFAQFAVEVDDAGAAGAFVEVVDVLGDDGNVVEGGFEFGKGEVTGVGGHVVELGAAGVVEVEHEAGVALPGFGGADVFDAVVFPQAVGVAEGGDAAVGAHAGAGEDDYFLLGFHGMVFLLRKIRLFGGCCFRGIEGDLGGLG